MPPRTRVEVEQADQHLADDARADRSKTIAPLAHIGFAKNVIPERRLTRPASARCTNLLGAQRPLAHPPRHRLARRQTDALATLQVTHGEGVKFFDFGRTSEGHR